MHCVFMLYKSKINYYINYIIYILKLNYTSYMNYTIIYNMVELFKY